jgi:hypothetical protein
LPASVTSTDLEVMTANCIRFGIIYS